MEQLNELRNKNELLIKLQNGQLSGLSGPASGQYSIGLFADVLLKMQRAFGPSDTLRCLRVLQAFLPLVDEQLFQVLSEVSAAGSAPREPREKPESDADMAAQTSAPVSCACHVTIEGVDLAQSALEDFMNSYYMFHDLDAGSTSDILKYLPFLGFMESHIYDLDQANEDFLNPEQRSSSGLEDDPFVPLRQVLQERSWMSLELEKEFQCGARFWALERKICSALAVQDSIQQHEVEEALRLKSFDYRAMNLLLYNMRGVAVNRAHMDFLATSEILVEIGDDLADYYDDIERNSFNVYRCFLAIHGLEKGASELQNFILSAERAYSTALAALQEVDKALAAKWLERSMSSRRFCCGSEKPEGGSWEIPPPVQEKQKRALSGATLSFVPFCSKID